MGPGQSKLPNKVLAVGLLKLVDVSLSTKLFSKSLWHSKWMSILVEFWAHFLLVWKTLGEFWGSNVAQLVALRICEVDFQECFETLEALNQISRVLEKFCQGSRVGRNFVETT